MCHSSLKRQNSTPCLVAFVCKKTEYLKHLFSKTHLSTRVSCFTLCFSADCTNCCSSAQTQTNSQLLLSVGRSIHSGDPNILQGMKTDRMSSLSLHPHPNRCVWSSIGLRCVKTTVDLVRGNKE